MPKGIPTGFLFNHGGEVEIFLTALEDDAAEAAAGQTRILYCSGSGSLSTGKIAAEFYQRLAARLDEFGRQDKSCAVVVISRPQAHRETYILEITANQARTLDKILHAVYDVKEIPRVFHKSIREIVKLARTREKQLREELVRNPGGRVPGIYPCPES